MIRKLWNVIGDIRLSFWLLLAAAALFFTGSLYTSLDFSYFKAMNELRIQDWLSRELPARPGANWWLVPLFAVLFLLGVNTVICTLNRVIALFSARTKTDYRFVLALLPSVVHLLFITVMLGHAVTITMGSWNRLPLAEGAVLQIDPSVPPLTVGTIKDEFFQEGSFLANRIRQTTVPLAGAGDEIRLSYLDSIKYHGYRLHLDMVKKKTPGNHENRHAQMADSKETCNRSETFRSGKRTREPAQELYLLAIADPGLPVILASFSLILVIMTWYFIESMRRRDREA